MPSVIVSLRWAEPVPGGEAKVATLMVDEVRALEGAVDWIRGAAGQEWGGTVARVDLHGTRAREGDMSTLDEVLRWLATNVRYDTGEGIYGADCPAFRAQGIVRS